MCEAPKESVHVEIALEKVETMLQKSLQQLKLPMSMDSCHLELGTNPLLPPLMVPQCRSLIGVAIWMIVLGLVDINYAMVDG